jgi:hypothetical protein
MAIRSFIVQATVVSDINISLVVINAAQNKLECLSTEIFFGLVYNFFSEVLTHRVG